METSQFIEISKEHSLKEFIFFITKFLGFDFQDIYDKDSGIYHYYDDLDYRYYSGVYLRISEESSNYEIELWTDLVSYSFYDIKYLNACINAFKKYFNAKKKNGYWGSPKRLKYEGIIREKAESGCYLAYESFKNNFGKVKTYIFTKNFSNFPPVRDVRTNLAHHPEIISNNLIIPFMISSLETYFRSTFLALFRYSEKKESIFKKYGNKLTDELENVSNGEISIDDVLVKNISFQNIDSICRNYELINKEIRLMNLLREERINGTSLYEHWKHLLELRHRIIHRSKFFEGYFRDSLLSDIDIIYLLVDKFYNFLIGLYKWQKDDDSK